LRQQCRLNFFSVFLCLFELRSMARTPKSNETGKVIGIALGKVALASGLTMLPGRKRPKTRSKIPTGKADRFSPPEVAISGELR
jgi:hypothetical protein